MKQPHKHAEFIKAWADGAEIQFNDGKGWWDSTNPTWNPASQYRIKPEPNPDYVEYFWATFTGVLNSNSKADHNLKLTFDGETSKLKSAEVL